ncbi:hypothetical protein BKA58DRAFT_434373 [Alternaria rosae]|uniref:uncharacterized protein n=1 Tax=Alternaria rosae TaxID=1187941 RepID=UPI001E8D0273|nr:uncharacterized protein BKA58DRAFT_434373 [Alternaria rosae]KAH6882612.1 hypothetical protein BKA58DRAFT_434373 [Alternaria rosae]
MGRYARIKLQTNVAIPWLIETARGHGSNMQVTSDKNSNPLATPSPTPSTSSAKTGRLKGKARKEAKKMEQPQVQASSPKKNASGISYKCLLRRYFARPVIWKISVKSLSSPDLYGMPSRRLCEAVRSTPPGLLKKSPSTKVTPATWHPTTQHDKELTLNNLFEALQDIELPNDTSETATLDVPSDESTTDGALLPTPPARYEPPTDSKEELRLRWLCFKDEADSIISWVIGIWKQYFHGCEEDANLKTASLLSDLALELIYKLEDDMTDDRDMVQGAKLIESASL